MIHNFQKWKWKSLSHVRLYSPFVVHGIPARILEWVVITFSRVFPTQGSNSSLPHCGRILYQLSYQGIPQISPKFRSYYTHTHTYTHIYDKCWWLRQPCGKPCVGKIPWRMGSLPIPVLRPGEIYGLHGQLGHKELDMTEWLSLSPSDSKRIYLWCKRPGSVPGSGRFPGEGSGNSLQYSCLEKSHGQRSLTGYSPWGA